MCFPASNSTRSIKLKEEDKMQGGKLYVGNLSYSVTSEQLKELFAGCGVVKEVKIIEGKGFGFVEMGTQLEAENAKKDLGGTQFMGRSITVEEARPQREKPRGGRGGGAGGGFGRRY
jgi:RNA recognition motif-containing protein